MSAEYKLVWLAVESRSNAYSFETDAYAESVRVSLANGGAPVTVTHPAHDSVTIRALRQ